MRLQNNLVIAFMLISSSTYCQDALWLIRATPVEDPYLYNNEIPASLLKYNQDSMKLSEVVNLAAYDNRIKDIRYYYDYKRIIITKETKKFESNLWIVSTAPFDSLINKSVSCPSPYSYLTYKLLSIDKMPNVCLECINTKFEKYRYLKGYDLTYYTEREFEDNDYKNLILSGTNFYINQNDFQDIYTEPTNGQLRIPVVRNIDERPIFPLVLPDSLQVRKKMGLLIIINNKNQFVLKQNSTAFKSDQLGSTSLIIYNYNSQKWNRQKIKGNYPSINSFGNWLSGTVYDYTGIIDNTFKESPGKNVRKRLNSKNEFNADIRFAYFHVYSPGILYLFNTLTNNYIEWTTDQGDSEILLVENNDVYYRVNDEIYKAPILNGKKLGKAELLVKNEMVPDIHWAFLAK